MANYTKLINPIHPQLQPLLDTLTKVYPTRRLLAEALGVSYPTVAHYFDGRSLPGFEVTLKMVELIEKIGD